MARRSGTFLDRILEGVVVACTALFFLGGPVSLAVIGGIVAVLRLVRLWFEVKRRHESP